MDSRPPLKDANGQPLQGSDGLLVPHARGFAAVWNAVNRTYHWRWDEALKHSSENALAMGRDLFINSLRRERTDAVINAKWSLEVDDDKDARQKEVRDELTKLVKMIPAFHELTRGLHYDGIFIGRQGVQWKWGLAPYYGGTTVTSWKPLNGDKIQYQWDDTPVVIVGHEVARFYEAQDPQLVIRADGLKSDPAARTVISTDRGGYGLRLYTPEWRRRFGIFQYHRVDADFFEGDLAGGVNGVGIRHYCYWGNWIQLEVFDWLFSTMESTGTMDLYIFNYSQGNAQAKAAAEANARQMTTKLALAVPRDPAGNWPAVEVVPFNAAGAETLKGILQEFFRQDIERFIVGQSMSAGQDESGSLGGTGRAEFATDTKFQIVESDAKYLGETLTTDLIEPMKRFNFPDADFPVRLCYGIDDPENPERLQAGISLIGVGVPVKADELRAAGGYTKPEDGDEVVGMMPAGPDGMPLSPDDSGGESGRAATSDDKTNYVWDESKHKRGQPDNAGQFGSGGGPPAPVTGVYVQGARPTSPAAPKPDKTADERRELADSAHEQYGDESAPEGDWLEGLDRAGIDRETKEHTKRFADHHATVRAALVDAGATDDDLKEYDKLVSGGQEELEKAGAAIVDARKDMDAVEPSHEKNLAKLQAKHEKRLGALKEKHEKRLAVLKERLSALVEPEEPDYEPEPDEPEEPDLPEALLGRGDDDGPTRDEYDTDAEFQTASGEWRKYVEWQSDHENWQKDSAAVEKRNEKSNADWEKAHDKWESESTDLENDIVTAEEERDEKILEAEEKRDAEISEAEDDRDGEMDTAKDEYDAAVEDYEDTFRSWMESIGEEVGEVRDALHERLDSEDAS